MSARWPKDPGLRIPAPRPPAPMYMQPTHNFDVITDRRLIEELRERGYHCIKKGNLQVVQVVAMDNLGWFRECPRDEYLTARKATMAAAFGRELLANHMFKWDIQEDEMMGRAQYRLQLTAVIPE